MSSRTRGGTRRSGQSTSLRRGRAGVSGAVAVRWALRWVLGVGGSLAAVLRGAPPSAVRRGWAPGGRSDGGPRSRGTKRGRAHRGLDEPPAPAPLRPLSPSPSLSPSLSPSPSLLALDLALALAPPGLGLGLGIGGCGCGCGSLTWNICENWSTFCPSSTMSWPVTSTRMDATVALAGCASRVTTRCATFVNGSAWRQRLLQS